MVNKRNSSIELLRILAMIMIIFSHYCYNNVNSLELPFSVNKVFLQVLFLGNLGSALFFLISGYFAVNNTFKLNKLLKLIFQVLFYSLGLYVVLTLLGIIPFSIFELLKSLFPIIFEQYWFISVYIILYLLSDYIVKMFKCLDRKDFRRVILILVVIWFVIPTVTTYTLYGEPFGRAFIAYIIVIYFNLYNDNIINNKYNKKMLFLGSILIVMSSLVLNLLSIKFSIFNHGTMLVLPQSFVQLGVAVGLFSLFISKKFNNRLIDMISGTVFGIYLLHNNPNITNYLWNNIFHIKKYVDSSYMILEMLGVVTLIFVSCSLIEIIRKNTIGKLVDNLIDKFFNKKYSKE